MLTHQVKTNNVFDGLSGEIDTRGERNQPTRIQKWPIGGHRMEGTANVNKSSAGYRMTVKLIVTGHKS